MKVNNFDLLQILLENYSIFIIKYYVMSELF